MGSAAAGAVALGAVAGATSLVPKVLAVSAGAGERALAAVGAKAQPSNTSGGPMGLPSSWDYFADVVVCGYGLAGATAAYEATVAGAKVIVLEKASSDYAGGNSKIGGSMSLSPH